MGIQKKRDGKYKLTYLTFLFADLLKFGILELNSFFANDILEFLLSSPDGIFILRPSSNSIMTALKDYTLKLNSLFLFCKNAVKFMVIL